jgi:DNA repair protein RecO (recombination protein O)
MPICRSEGVILQVVKYQEHDQIHTVFTPDNGLIKIFSSGAILSKAGLRGINPSLAKVELIYAEGKNDLHKGKEISMLSPHIHLRQENKRLESVLEMAKTLLKSQLSYKPAPDLYRLFIYYIEKLKDISNAGVLTASFQMKLLKHEGWLNLSFICSKCHSPLQDLSLFEGETYCPMHAPTSSFLFNEEEALQLYLLAYTRSFAELASLHLPSCVKEKINQLCDSLLNK